MKEEELLKTLIQSVNGMSKSVNALTKAINDMDFEKRTRELKYEMYELRRKL